MTTLADVRARVADMLMRSDLDTQIDREIQLAIERHSRKVTWLTEVRAATLTSVIGQTWYETISLATAAGIEDVSARTAVSVADVQKVEYIRDAGYDELLRVDYKTFERFIDTTVSTGSPTYYTLYAGQIGLWPVPDAVEVFTLSAVVKPLMPSAGADSSVWFDKAQELIEASAASAVAAKFVRDMESAAVFKAVEAEALNDLQREGNLKMSSGRIRAHE